MRFTTDYQQMLVQLEITKYMSSAAGGIPVGSHTENANVRLLYPYQYSIVMENGRYPNWITEKLIDCLLSRTIPIYWGAPNVGEYFDRDGILTFDNI